MHVYPLHQNMYPTAETGLGKRKNTKNQDKEESGNIYKMGNRVNLANLYGKKKIRFGCAYND